MLIDDWRPSRGAFDSFIAAHCDEDSVLDQWLASLSPGQFEYVFDSLARLQDHPLRSLEPTA